MVDADWPEVEAIYRAGIASGQATFEAAPPPSWESFNADRLPDLRLVAVAENGEVLGWATASRVSTRDAYRGVVEHSVYVRPDARGEGIGAALLAELITVADRLGIWTIQSSVFPDNTPSLRLHQRHGFRVVGRRERIAQMPCGPLAGQWRDTLLIGRRAPQPTPTHE